MTNKLLTACIQTNAAPDIQVNLDRIAPMLEQARSKGARFIALPECVSIMNTNRASLFAQSGTEETNIAVAFFRRQAQAMGVYILAGSIAVAGDQDRLANRSFLFDPAGEIAARYDKIHMFDANLSPEETYRESANYRGGSRAVVADLDLGAGVDCRLGMSVCYDVRFPHLFRALAKAGANVIAIPAAFVATTGRLHWHVLVRARAIETGSFILAPGQCGTHEGNRHTYGHSLIVAPTGEIIAEAGEDPEIIYGELDLDQVFETRRKLPSLMHDCDFTHPARRRDD